MSNLQLHRYKPILSPVSIFPDESIKGEILIVAARFINNIVQETSSQDYFEGIEKCCKSNILWQNLEKALKCSLKLKIRTGK